MRTGFSALRTYLELADWYERQSQAQMRDRFLLLAADTALAAGQADEAERLRLRLLEHSPHHMLRPFASFAEAVTSPDVQGYLSDLRQTYPPETAEQLLESLHANGEGGPAPQSPPPKPEPAQQTSARPAEPLKVYRVKDEEAEPKPRQVPPPAPARKTAPARQEVLHAEPRPKPRPKEPAGPTVPSPAAARPAPEPTRPRPPAPRPDPPRPFPGPLPALPARPAEADEPADAGGWVALVLFAVVLVLGAALAVYTFAHPFLPAGWLP